MTDKEFRELLHEYPFLLDDIYSTSLTHAKDLYKDGFPLPAEILERAKKKYPDVPAEAWKIYEDALNK